jgi:hypothetical protein
MPTKCYTHLSAEDRETKTIQCRADCGGTQAGGDGGSRIRTGFGPENMTRLRRFAVGILKSFQKPAQSLAEMMRTLCFRTRLVFDYLRMTKTSVTGARAA